VTKELSTSAKNRANATGRIRRERNTLALGAHARAIQAFSTGSPSLDLATGIGGWPRGRIVELYGKAGTGKTTLGLTLVAELQKSHQKAAYFDSDHKLAPHWLAVCGVDPSAHKWMETDDYLETLRMVLDAVETGEFAAVIVDTLAAAPIPDDFKHYGPEIGHTARVEQILERAIARLASAVSRTNTCLLLLNQVRKDHDVLFGNPIRSVGGLPLEHACSLRAEIARLEPIKADRNTVLGHIARVTVTKNLLGAPFRQASIAITHRFGLDGLYERVCLGHPEKTCDPLRSSRLNGGSMGGINEYLELAETYSLPREESRHASLSTTPLAS
jgi:recombination protein RecA